MSTPSFRRWLAIGTVIVPLLGIGCDAAPPTGPSTGPDRPSARDAVPSARDQTKLVEPRGTKMGKNVFLEIEGETRRVIIEGEVCLREGRLEELVCKKNTNEHEAILSADVDAFLIHATLIAAGAKPGAPVKFEPKFEPARGSAIKISLQYKDKQDQLVTVNAQDWIRNPRTKQPLDQNWVFGGSQLAPNPNDKKKPLYLANYGDVICLCNTECAMLDLPIESPKRLGERMFEAHTERIPPLETKVSIILEVLPKR